MVQGVGFPDGVLCLLVGVLKACEPGEVNLLGDIHLNTINVIYASCRDVKYHSRRCTE